MNTNPNNNNINCTHIESINTYDTDNIYDTYDMDDIY